MKKKRTGEQKKLAEAIGISPIYLNAVLRGRRGSSIPLALKIEELSKGKYKAVDLRPDLKDIVKKVINL
jgi:DNA-binding transcriptional regulator YdaS (Cro superfamily)